MAMLANYRCSVHRIPPRTSVCLTRRDGPLLLLTLGGGVHEEVSGRSLSFQHELSAHWEPFSTPEVILKSTTEEGHVYAVQVTSPVDTLHSAVAFGADPAVSTDVGTKLLFQNGLVRVWAFEVAPGFSCHIHQHVLDYFFLNMEVSDTLGLDREGQLKGNVARQTSGQLTFVSVSGPPYPIHGLVNVGSNTFQQFVVEFKARLSKL
mmetsp:Transcript_639/g.1620  ORF Transcript_639/g.1620 Transcript_639/m.1620 type:complete len:206 (+) Transcript_639:33-650(+)